MQNPFQYIKQGRVHSRRVFFSGAGALAQGVGLCYDRVRSAQAGGNVNLPATVATVNDETRDGVVALPATANRGDFAGVTMTNYLANASGQFVWIAEPGSIVQIAVNVATVINSTMVTFGVNADPGVFGKSGLGGRGSAIAMQTTLTASASSGNGPISSSLDGTATFTFSTLNVLKTGLFANAIAGDFLVVFGGATAADGTVPVTPGVYTIKTVTDANNAILATSPQASGTSVIACAVVRGNRPLVLAKLLDGPESGGVDWFTGASGGAEVLDVNGFTYCCNGGITLAADDVPTLAVNPVEGRQRGFQCLGTITTSHWLITPTATTAIQRNGTSTLASLSFNAASQSAVLEMGPTKWSVQHLAGATQA